MNYGDGYYGGVFIGAMYALAFTNSNIDYIVKEALKTIPARSEFYQCINDVITWHKKYPGDWHQNWFEIQKKWSGDIACPDGIFRPFNIDSKINSAYVVLGLLYGNGDFSKTMDIATRSGQDADCNPSSAGGILGTILGYDKIPDFWKMGLKEAEDIDFKYTTISLNKVYDIGFKHALLNVERHGGKVNGNSVIIPVEAPKAVPFEKGFSGIYPIESRSMYNNDIKLLTFSFEGTGFMLSGEARKKRDITDDYVFEATMSIDGKKVETAKLPTNFTTRRNELFWQYDLPKGKHTVSIEVLNPSENYNLASTTMIVFSNQPSTTTLISNN